MKNSILFTFCLCYLLSFGYAQQGAFTIKVKTNDIPDNTVVYLQDEELGIHIDSTEIIDNEFSFKGEIEDVGYKRYWLMASVNRTRYEYISLWVVPGEITVDGSNGILPEAVVIGSYLHDQRIEMDKARIDWEKRVEAIEKELSSISENDKDKAKALKQKLATCERALSQADYEFVKNHPDYLHCAFYLTFLKNRLPKSKTQELYDGFTDKIKQSKYAQAVKTWLELSTDLKVGDQAVDFELPNLQGEQVALSSFQGKYVLLEFGASGCWPCRQENPNLLKAYQKYQSKGFEIVSVWLDKNQGKWENTVKKDKMIWTNLSDLKGNNGPIPLTYNVTYIPRNLLLDPAGKIIATDLRGGALGNKLEELFPIDE